MPITDLLQRLRPVGTPGTAAPVAVPADDAARAAAELEPVFAALAPVIAQCTAMREAAGRRAAGTGARAAQEADAILTAARTATQADRAAAAAAVRDRGERAAVALRAAAQDEAAQVVARGRSRLPGLVGLVVTRLRDRVTPSSPTTGTEP